MIVSAFIPANGATRCQSSSVINGIIGWFKRSIVSKTRTNVCRVPRFSASLKCSFNKTGLDNSKYQSQ